METLRCIGGKGGEGIAQRIISLMPPHRTYVEAFLGAGAVLRKKRPAAVTLALDLDADRLAAMSKFLRGHAWRGPAVELKQLDAVEWIERNGPTLGPDVVVYCDPPYVHAARSRANYYRHEMDDAAHVRLLDALAASTARVILSGYPSRLYSARGFESVPALLRKCRPGWSVETFLTMTRGHIWATECLWFNFPLPAKLHDPRFVGADRRERWRIEKRRRRLVAKFFRMTATERHAVFDALSEAMDTAADAASGVAMASARA